MTQGPLHDYLGMTIDYSVPGQVLSHNAKKMVKEFPQENLKGAPVTSLGMKTSLRYNMTVVL